MGAGLFLGVKRPGHGVDRPSLSSVKVKERVELYLYSPLWAFIACTKVNFTFTYVVLKYQELHPSRAETGIKF
jgi:hypothetical protein